MTDTKNNGFDPVSFLLSNPPTTHTDVCDHCGGELVTHTSTKYGEFCGQTCSTAAFTIANFSMSEISDMVGA